MGHLGVIPILRWFGSLGALCVWPQATRTIWESGYLGVTLFSIIWRYLLSQTNFCLISLSVQNSGHLLTGSPSELGYLWFTVNTILINFILILFIVGFYIEYTARWKTISYFVYMNWHLNKAMIDYRTDQISGQRWILELIIQRNKSSIQLLQGCLPANYLNSYYVTETVRDFVMILSRPKLHRSVHMGRIYKLDSSFMEKWIKI